MAKRLLLVFSVLVMGLAWAPLHSQAQGRLPFALLGLDQGLPSVMIQSVAQDHAGFMWVGTETGLFRLEGERTTRWTREEGLPSGYINRILPTPWGGLWVATFRGLVRFREGRIEAVKLGLEVSASAVSHIALDPGGRLWVATVQGLFVQEEGLQFKPVPCDLLPNVTAVVAGRSGATYVAGKLGIQAFLKAGGTRRWGLSDGLPKEGCAILVEDGSGRLWAGSGRSLAVLEPGGKRFVDRSSLLPASLSTNSSPYLDSDGTVWLPTQDGALHLADGRAERLDASMGLPFRWVRSLFRDSEGSLWVFGPGLARMQGLRRIRNHTLSPGAAGEIFWFVTRDRRGRLVAGTDDGAAYLGTNGFERIPGSEGRRIKGLAEDAQGVLWMVSSTGAALWLQPGQRKAETAPLGEPGVGNHVVLADSKGDVWLGHAREGIFRWDPKSRKLVQELAPGAFEEKLLAAFHLGEDSAGRLWAGTSNGLSVRTGPGRWLHFGPADGLPNPCMVYGSAFLPDGSAWLRFQEPVGLRRVRLVGDRLVVLEQRVRGQGLRSNMVYAVQVDAKGRTWAATDQGVDRLDPPLHLGRFDGMASEDCSVNALFIEQAHLWVGTAAGLVSLDLSGLDPERPPPQAHILGLAIGARRVVGPLSHLEPVPSAEATLTFRVGAPSYLNDRELRFQVRLVGLEKGWLDTGVREIRYPSLAGGSYRFEVRVAQGSGPFGPVSALDFKVLPPWWKTWWALTLESLAVLAAFAGVVRLRVANLARSKGALERQVVKRTEELRTRNQELSEALGRVKQLSGLLPICASCKKIRDDHGYWNQLEQYITEHSEAGFSHGICPDCAKVMYPDFVPRRTGAPGNL